jgi:hypothetical protein
MKTALPDPASIGNQGNRAESPGERRLSRRAEAEGCATAFCLGGGHFGQMFTMKACDYCEGGVAVYCRTPVPPGSDVAIGFESRHCSAGRGTVLRCQPCEEGYRVAIRFCGTP